RRGRTVVTDGPFAETKDVVGGYSLVRAASRAEAIELAKRCPHAKWGPIEVREVIYFDRV
ncbi:MAG: YciI family protein, partial [Candidatus Binatia bacterium]